MTRRIRLPHVALLVGVLLLSAPALGAEAQPKPSLHLRFATIEEGNHECAHIADPDRTAKDPLWFRDEPFAKNGKAVGVDVTAPPDPLVAYGFKDGQLYYLFYTLAEEAFGGPCLVQRVKRTITDFPGADGAEPITSTTYKVEMIRTSIGEAICPERHSELLALGQFDKRQAAMEFEIGFLEAEDISTGPRWPGIPDKYAALAHDWRPDPSTYQKLQFVASRKWTLNVSFSRNGTYSVQVPEVGMNVPGTPPKADVAKPYQDASSESVVLKDGVGVGEIVIGKSMADDVERVFGPPLLIQRANSGCSCYCHAKGLVFRIYNNGVVGEITVRPSFAGQTAKGVRLGMSRARVAELYGSADRAMGIIQDAMIYTTQGVIFYLDDKDRVGDIQLSAK
jgi:hypothetical protein